MVTRWLKDKTKLDGKSMGIEAISFGAELTRRLIIDRMSGPWTIERLKGAAVALRRNSDAHLCVLEWKMTAYDEAFAS